MLKNWKPAIVIKLSLLIHLGAIIALVFGVSWPWPAGIIFLNHLLLTIVGLWPRSTLLGSNMLTLPQAQCLSRYVAITIDDGPDPEITPKVLDILDRYGAKASFFCIGKSVEAYPMLAREIVQRGHCIENHSYSHRHYFSIMGLAALRSEISKAQDIIVNVTDFKPKYFRAPAGLRSPLLDVVLQALNLQLVSWTKRGFDTRDSQPNKVLRRLEKNLKAGDILLLHDCHGAVTSNGQPVILEVLPKLLTRLQNLNLRAVSLN